MKKISTFALVVGTMLGHVLCGILLKAWRAAEIIAYGEVRPSIADTLFYLEASSVIVVFCILLVGCLAKYLWQDGASHGNRSGEVCK